MGTDTFRLGMYSLTNSSRWSILIIFVSAVAPCNVTAMPIQESDKSLSPQGKAEGPNAIPPSSCACYSSSLCNLRVNFTKRQRYDRSQSAERLRSCFFYI